MRVKFGSRDSALAVIQSELIMNPIRDENPHMSVELVTMKTTGDQILDRTLDQIGGKGLFVKELDQALRDKRVDFTVHSLKDVPMEICLWWPFPGGKIPGIVWFCPRAFRSWLPISPSAVLPKDDSCS